MQFKLGDVVTWKNKIGVVVEVLPPGARPYRSRFPSLYPGCGFGRMRESYVVNTAPVSKAPKFYWPREGLLRQVQAEKQMSQMELAKMREPKE